MTVTTKKRVLVCEFHQETDTFNPFSASVEDFAALRYAEGQEAYDLCKKLPCAFHGMIDAIENDRKPYVDATAGRNALEMILAIYQSAATGKPVKLPLENVASTDFTGRFGK